MGMNVCALLSSLFSFQSLKGLSYYNPKTSIGYYVTTKMLLDLTKSSFIFINHFCWNLLHDLIFSLLSPSHSLTHSLSSLDQGATFNFQSPSLNIIFLKDAVK